MSKTMAFLPSLRLCSSPSELRLERAVGKTSSNLEEGSGASEEPQKPFATEGAPTGTVFSVPRPEKFGGPMHFSTYIALREAFENRKVHPKDLKGAVADALVSLLAPIRKRFEESKEWQEVTELAYPSPVPEKKKKKEKVYHPPPPGKGKNAKPAVATNATTDAPAVQSEEPSAASA